MCRRRRFKRYTGAGRHRPRASGPRRCPVAETKQQQLHDIGELCEDLAEHLDENEQAEAIATAEQILQRVRQYFGAGGA